MPEFYFTQMLGDSSGDAAAKSLASETSTSPAPVTSVSISSEPSENAVYSIQHGLYTPPTTPTLVHGSPETAASGPRVTPGGYKTVPVSEPDLSKMPERSALKGSKTRQCEEKRQGKENQQEPVAVQFNVDAVIAPLHPAPIQFNTTGVLPRVRPKTPPKPKTGP